MSPKIEFRYSEQNASGSCTCPDQNALELIKLVSGAKLCMIVDFSLFGCKCSTEIEILNSERGIWIVVYLLIKTPCRIRKLSHCKVQVVHLAIRFYFA
jgi:hypothetical protein